MSSSTIFIKQPLNYRQSLALIKEKYKEYSPAFSGILWSFSGLYAAPKTDFNTNISGTILSFPIHSLILLSVSSLLLYKGLKKRSISLLLPWICVAIYTLYYNHYPGLVKTFSIIQRVKKISWLPWFNLIISVVSLILRGTLTIRIFQLCIHLWFKKKLDEMKEKEV